MVLPASRRLSGLISLSGCAQLSYTLDTIGPLTRNASDAAILTQCLSGYDKNDIRTWCLPETSMAVSRTASGARPLEGVRLAIFPPNTYAVDVAPSIWAAIHDAKVVLTDLGVQIEVCDSPLSFSTLFDVSGTLMTAEGYEHHENTIFNDSLDVGRETAERIRQGAKIALVDYVKALKQYDQARAGWDNWMQEQGLDAVIMPCTPVTAIAIEDVDAAGYPLGVLTRQGNVVGGCGLALPVGFDDQGLPIGMQLHGRAFNESRLVSIGMQYQRATNWHAMHPEIA